MIELLTVSPDRTFIRWFRFFLLLPLSVRYWWAEKYQSLRRISHHRCEKSGEGRNSDEWGVAFRRSADDWGGDDRSSSFLLHTVYLLVPHTTIEMCGSEWLWVTSTRSYDDIILSFEVFCSLCRGCVSSTHLRRHPDLNSVYDRGKGKSMNGACRMLLSESNRFHPFPRS